MHASHARTRHAALSSQQGLEMVATTIAMSSIDDPGSHACADGASSSATSHLHLLDPDRQACRGAADLTSPGNLAVLCLCCLHMYFAITVNRGEMIM